MMSKSYLVIIVVALTTSCKVLKAVNATYDSVLRCRILEFPDLDWSYPRG